MKRKIKEQIEELWDKTIYLFDRIKERLEYLENDIRDKLADEALITASALMAYSGDIVKNMVAIEELEKLLKHEGKD